MIVNMISKRLEAVIGPMRTEMHLAQEQALERIQQVIVKAEKEVAEDGQFMTSDQRLNQAKTELDKAEEHLLSALGSLMKALWYISPKDNPFIRIMPIKDIKGRVIAPDQNTTTLGKLGFLRR